MKLIDQKTLLFIFITMLFLIVVLFNINRESLWGDEAFSVMSIGGGSWNLTNFLNIILSII